MIHVTDAGIILCMRPANERRRYNVTSSLIGWTHVHKMIPADGVNDGNEMGLEIKEKCFVMITVPVGKFRQLFIVYSGLVMSYEFLIIVGELTLLRHWWTTTESLVNADWARLVMKT